MFFRTEAAKKTTFQDYLTKAKDAGLFRCAGWDQPGESFEEECRGDSGRCSRLCA